MTQLILKNDIQPHQLNSLLQLLQSRGIEAEVLPAAMDAKENVVTAAETPYDAFSESIGMWKDRDIDAKKLREQAWGLNKRLNKRSCTL
jgi:hypothetical protein